jgi:hypothetical protein
MSRWVLAGRIYFLVWVCLLSGVGRADSGQNVTELVEKGNWLYQEKDYLSAMDSYRQAEHMGAKNPELFYNIGNTAFRLNKVGLAILYYERALWLNPGHDDARYNLNYVEQFLTDRIPEPEISTPARVWNWLLSRVGLTATSWIGLVVWALLCLSFVMFFSWRHEPRRRPAGVILTAVLLVFIIWSAIFAGMIWRQETVREGVVLASKVDIRSGPAEDDPVLFTIHEGHKLGIRGTSDEWYQIVLPNGWNGWTPARFIGEIQREDFDKLSVYFDGESENVAG